MNGGQGEATLWADSNIFEGGCRGGGLATDGYFGTVRGGRGASEVGVGASAGGIHRHGAGEEGGQGGIVEWEGGGVTTCCRSG